MKPVVHIRLKDFYNDTIHFRESASALIELIKDKNPDSVELDFQDIDFISRSFADQLHKEQLKLNSQGINLYLINASADIHKMLNIVANTQNSPVNYTEVYKVRYFTDTQSLTDYLLHF